MTLDDRITIEKGLEQKWSLHSIAARLGKDSSTISKEIKKHRSFQEHNHFNEPKNKWTLVEDCKKKNICGIYAPGFSEQHPKAATAGKKPLKSGMPPGPRLIPECLPNPSN